jgi:hypothetical protein
MFCFKLVFFTGFYPHSSQRVFCKSSPPFKVTNLEVLNVVCVQNRYERRLLSPGFYSLKLFVLNTLYPQPHTLSGVHLTPSLTDTPHLLTNVSNFGV